MPGIRRDWRRIALSVGVAAQTIVALAAGQALATSHSGLAVGLAAGSWAALGLLASALYAAKSLFKAVVKGETGRRPARPADHRDRFVWPWA